LDSCCADKASELAQLRARQSRVLYVVLAINALGFLVEFAAGLIARSTALLADALDMFGDASVYALTLFVLHRSLKARAGAALFKGGLMLLFGLLVIVAAVRRLMLQEMPAADWMGGIGLLALTANGACFALLYGHRSDDLNMRSTWLCSRNDLLANASVIVAAGLVALTGSLWPDVVLGLAIAALFLHSTRQVLREAWQQWTLASESPNVPEPSPACCAPAGSPISPGRAPTALVALAEPGPKTDPPSQAASCCAAEAKPAQTKGCQARHPPHGQGEF
jgi:cation diffusion facilitator family transporter